jgi:hypothetical protein
MTREGGGFGRQHSRQKESMCQVAREQRVLRARGAGQGVGGFSWARTERQGRGLERGQWLGMHSFVHTWEKGRVTGEMWNF